MMLMTMIIEWQEQNNANLDVCAIDIFYNQVKNIETVKNSNFAIRQRRTKCLNGITTQHIHWLVEAVVRFLITSSKRFWLDRYIILCSHNTFNARK